MLDDSYPYNHWNHFRNWESLTFWRSISFSKEINIFNGVLWGKIINFSRKNKIPSTRAYSYVIIRNFSRTFQVMWTGNYTYTLTYVFCIKKHNLFTQRPHIRRTPYPLDSILVSIISWKILIFFLFFCYYYSLHFFSIDFIIIQFFHSTFFFFFLLIQITIKTQTRHQYLSRRSIACSMHAFYGSWIKHTWKLTQTICFFLLRVLLFFFFL